jgi:hypothetical protein
MHYFVDEGSIVRKIWGKSDTILFIFAGASAEFALNKAVDWLYFTGKLPADPLGRLFSTVSYARRIVFSENEKALQAIDKITAIHSFVEMSRGSKIPEWAYRDVLFMLIHYSIASYELLERKLTSVEKEEVFDVFYRFGNRMGLTGLPSCYNEWLVMREDHLNNHLEKSHFTVDLYIQYRQHLGWFRFRLLLQSQALVVPPQVKKLMRLSDFPLLSIAISPYKLSRKIGLDRLIKRLILPGKYRGEINSLDR